ncbi:aldo/keto reductase [Paenibacillus sepulcri]
MQYRKLGSTGLDVSILSFGASSLGSVFRDINEEEGIRTVHAAIDAGINYIDVSPYYGLTKAETVLGKAIRQLPRDRFLLSTKAGRYGVDTFDFSAKRIRESLEESLQRLNTDYVDMLFLHDMEFESLDVIVEEGIPELNRLKEQGKIRYAGISGLPLDIFPMTIDRAGVDVILSYCHYSLNDTTLLGQLPYLEQHSVGVVNASPLSMGLLSSRGVPDWHLASREMKDVCRQAALYCQEQGVDIAKLAVQFSVSEERIPTTLISSANPVNITNNVRWAEEKPDPAVLQAVLEILSPIQGKTWPSGRPEYNRSIKV